MAKEKGQMTAAKLLTLWKKWDRLAKRDPSEYNLSQRQLHADALNELDYKKASSDYNEADARYPGHRYLYEASLQLHSIVEWRCLHRDK